MAQADRDFADDEDADQHTSKLDQASQTKHDKIEAAENTYEAAEAGKVATRLLAEAGANKTYAQAAAQYAYTRQTADADALDAYETADSNAYATLTANQALLDKNYAIAEALSLQNMADAFAAATGTASPWATQYAASLDAYDDWSDDAFAAQETQRDNVSGAQRDGEIGLADAENAISSAAALADYTQAVTLATTAFSIAQAQAAAITGLGPTGNYEASYPVLETAAATNYAVTAASSGDFSIGSSVTTGACYGWPQNSWYWNNGYCGWGYGYWGGYYGGYWGGYGYAYGYWPGYYDPSYYGTYGPTDPATAAVSTPAELSLPAGFWDSISQDAGAAYGFVGNDLIASPDNLELVSPTPNAQPESDGATSEGLSSSNSAGQTVHYAASSLAPSLGVGDSAGSNSGAAAASTTQFVNAGEADSPENAPFSLKDSVAAILGLFDKSAGEFWSKYGHVFHVTVPDRPELGAQSPSPDASKAQGHLRDGMEVSPAENEVTIVASFKASAADIANQVAKAIADTGSKIHRAFEDFAEDREISAARKAEMAQLESRERELADKLDKLLRQTPTFFGIFSFYSSYYSGLKEGFLQGVQDGLLGMAWSATGMAWKAGVFAFQLIPKVIVQRLVCKSGLG